jgi:selenocysteine lyase/cysteine desulfurase
VQQRLATEHINVSLMDAASAQLDFGPRGLDQVVRSSVHYYNDDGDLDRLVEGVKEIAWSRS